MTAKIKIGGGETLEIRRGRAAFCDKSGEIYCDWSYKENQSKWKIIKRLIKELKK